MRLLSVAFFVCASLFASSLSDPDASKWYAIYTGSDNTGYVFLDSNKANIEAMGNWRNFDAVKGDKGDKGLRFRYSTVTKFLTCQAHESKFVGLSNKDKDTGFKADIGDDKKNHDKVVRTTFYKVEGGKWEVSLCLNFEKETPEDCIGPGAFRRKEEFKWKIGEVPAAS